MIFCRIRETCMSRSIQRQCMDFDYHPFLLRFGFPLLLNRYTRLTYRIMKIQRVYIQHSIESQDILTFACQIYPFFVR